MATNFVKVLQLITIIFLMVKANHEKCPEIKNKVATIQNINQESELLKLMSCLRGQNLRKLILKDFKLQYLPKKLFVNITVETLIIRDFFLDSLIARVINVHGSSVFEGLDESSVFEGLENSLKSLIILKPLKQTGVTYWQWEQFSVLKSLERLVISQEAFKENSLNKDFSRMGKLSLKWIQITGSCLSAQLGDRTFEAFEMAETINLEGNKLIKIDKEAFRQPAQKLKYLDLSNNELEILDHDLFSQMPNLLVVSLENNHIKQFSKFLGFIPKKFYIYGNPLLCDYTLRWLVADNYKLNNTPPFYEDGVRTLRCELPEHSMAGRIVRELTKNDVSRIESSPRPFFVFNEYLPIESCSY